jgi:hypothetical protein
MANQQVFSRSKVLFVVLCGGIDDEEETTPTKLQQNCFAV